MFCPEHISADDMFLKEFPCEMFWSYAAYLQRIEVFCIGEDALGIAYKLKAITFTGEIQNVKSVIHNIAVIERFLIPHCRDTLVPVLL